MSELNVLVKQESGSINFNYDEIKAELSNMMDLYKDAQFSDETIPVAKKERAGLNNLKGAIETKRKEVKNICMQPYTEFETKVKELIKLIDDPILLIDKQIKDFEERKKQEKSLKIKGIYDKTAGHLSEYIPLEKIYNPKWENSATSMKSIKEDIENLVNSTETAIQTIQGMNSEITEKALLKYKENLSLSDAIQIINSYEIQKAEILRKEQERRAQEEERQRQLEIERIRQEERKRIEEEERIKEEERQRVLEEIRIQEEVKVQEEIKVQESLSIKEDTESKPIRSFFVITASIDELDQVEMYLQSIGVNYERNDA